jgi:hyperosmotically inducible protein
MKPDSAEKKATKSSKETDSVIERNLKDAISRVHGGKIRGLIIDVKAGAVTLHGHADDAAQISGITATAERVKGVKNISNKITPSAPSTKETGTKAVPPSAHEKIRNATHETKIGG